jgi:hypothetical protein
MANRFVHAEETTMPVVPTVPGPSDPDLQRLITAASEDLADRVSIPADQIEVLDAAAVVWPDAALGCPQPGMRYKQVPVDGALIRLRAKGQVYEYHSGGRRGLFLCERPLEAQSDTPPRTDRQPPPPPGSLRD